MRSIRPRLAGIRVLVALGAALALAAQAGAATVLYRWVDADGITHYSDRPVPGAQKVQIAAAQTYKSTPVSGSANRRTNTQPAAPQYRSVIITSPTEGQSFVNAAGKVDAAASSDPPLASGHQLWFLIDGTRQPDPADGMAASFEVGRGTHTIGAVVTDDQGREVATAPPVTFYILQHSIANPPRGPLLPPKKN
jgi:hypothetical protein